jgi:hypothetical protein
MLQLFEADFLKKVRLALKIKVFECFALCVFNVKPQSL